MIVAALTCTATAATAGTPAARSPQHSGAASWHTSWANAQHSLAPTPLRDQSVRMISRLSQGGDALRIRVQNTFGKNPLTVDAATVAPSGGQSAALEGRPQKVTFAGRGKVVVPAGGEVWSDAVAMRTRAQDDVAVSLAVAGEASAGSHDAAFRTNYLSAPGSGDRTADRGAGAYSETVESTYLVTAVDVRNRDLRGTLVAYGSSVVDGTGSTNCGAGCTELGNNRRWTDDLARRIDTELPAGRRFAVANAGVIGTTSAADCPGTDPYFRGLDSLARLKRDVLSLHGVTGVLFYYGTNDLAAGCGADQVIASYRATFARLHAAGIKVYVTPVTPRPGYSDAANRARHEVAGFVKKWGTCTGTCDGVIDFDQVLKDPVKPNSINPAYDTGDGVHVNIAGQQALADFVSLPMVTSSERAPR
ncbi:SGNH/GDSL hydrolase family protein [Streptomyces sp. ITFR-16]|uniref:SGNH/GDSL hydrolase family protein n=1 Tax=Streptomyces sp. ITFR-16 TaxID=3075198 RepID=UPI002889845B|nr:GDSL-type esterase/lipase family protein [Streptomyces sp. ITFR-16]WNI21286.1 GDSL-type esterase/lipase family protein [Streptomyces sp. ITFR-16]